ncbi:hypothetical protein TWF569_006944 [Orbilia oligospora]|uniref:TMEM205-like domain-containing protein n=1 Tax=Orbilia oligospora TaxID=2813651 RepID=A0A4Z0X3X7_ORBOL|nr:hypothetical protein TWF102_007823 [Orbilia oligospora]KAF3100868.1 hypothetical protein TWF706_005965 [Orbilia oligospora]KAF3116676.1 hypothetical protein TWF103_008436 [Orbilia oligospora]KAF3134932.1 hypothetical protein TWF594_008544 [Orbilia oligospora]KAF3135156.1 hypothetical protein TWF703_006069 [Orbilia oligospora]
MPLISTVYAASHLLSYSFLFGTQIWHSFIGGIISFRVLPRAYFGALQRRLFPIYFSLQLILSLALLLTTPTSLKQLQPSKTYGFLLTVLATSFLNAVVAGPFTTRIMDKRKEQEVFDGRSYDGRKLPGVTEGAERGGDKENEEVRVSDEMRTLNKKFGMWHGISSLFNLGSVVGTIGYGVLLADKINFD